MSTAVLDIEIQEIDERPQTVMLISQAMCCEFPIKRRDIGKRVAQLHAEWRDLLEAEDLIAANAISRSRFTAEFTMVDHEPLFFSGAILQGSVIWDDAEVPSMVREKVSRFVDEGARFNPVGEATALSIGVVVTLESVGE